MENSPNEHQRYVMVQKEGGSGVKNIPFQSRIGTKLILGFLIVAVITGIVGYLSLSYSQIIGEKFHLLVLHTLPAINSLKEIKAAALDIEAETENYVFSPDTNKGKVLQEIVNQKSKFNNNLSIYEEFVNKYFPEETDLNESIHSTWNKFVLYSDQLVQLRQSVPLSSALPPSQLRQALNLEDEFQKSEDGLFAAIDKAISNEVDEVARRTSAVDTAIRDSSIVTIFSIIISVIAAVAFGLFFARYISKPISNLEQASIEIGKGDYVTACKFLSKTHRSDEIGKLSLEIEKMRQSIESMRTNLDKLVVQRTRELEIKNQALIEKEKELYRANEELIKTELAKEQFMSMVSHELKTPLTPLKMYSDMFLKTKVLGELTDKQKQAMKMMHNNVSKLEMLVSDVMDVYKLDIGKLKLNKKEVWISELVEENMSELQPLMKEKQIKFESIIDPHASNIAVVCDSKRVSQVIVNLVNNSVDFVPEKGGQIAIMVSTNETHDCVLFTVQDNGIGIPPEKVDNLFKSFYQIDTSITRKHGGTGLGLAICKGIIEAHGGKIWVDKDYLNGTSISFSIPVSETTVAEKKNHDRL
jgi:signal transduction histidine kinase